MQGLPLPSVSNGGHGHAPFANPLRDWFWAAYFVTTHTPGFSALQLQRQLGLTRYETAWALLHKLRRAMVRPERDPISGTVEVDETYVGGLEEGRGGGRKRESTKAIVVAAVEVRGLGSGRVRLATVKDLSGPTRVDFVKGAVAPGAASSRTLLKFDGGGSTGLGESRGALPERNRR